MALSNDIISQFAKKVVARDDKQDTGSTVYGTVVDYSGKSFVKIDGSDLLTPVSTTTDVQVGERVTVTIKNHTATVTGNNSSPSARKDDVIEIGNQITEVEILVADKVSTKEFDAQIGRIDDLTSDNVYIKDTLTANIAKIEELEAENVTITGELLVNKAEIDSLKATKLDAEVADLKYATIDELEATRGEFYDLEATFGEFEKLTTEDLLAQQAIIKDLQVTKLDVDQAEIKFANIDFSNIGKAAIEELFTKSGLIEDLIVGDGTITGNLVGITIKGDLIEGGTVIADKLVVKGEDGLYYKLNLDGETIEGEQTEYNSLNGSVITAKSITATKIAVDDLVAFDATIGGFKITSDSLYSGVKSSVNNTTRGTYFDDDGQFAIGDANDFIKYWKDTDGRYKLNISAGSVRISSINKTVEEAIGEVEDEVADVQKNILEMNTLITSTAEEIVFEALQSYTESSDYNSFKETVEAQLKLMAEQMTLQFTQQQSILEAVNGGLQEQITNITKYFTFDIDGLTIGQPDSPNKVVVDNDEISIVVNGNKVQTFNSAGKGVIPQLEVTQEFNFFGYTITQDGSGNVNLDYTG